MTRLIDADTTLTVQMYDDEHEEWYTEVMTVDELISKSADETPPTVQQWIPCSEKLPRTGKNVLISMDDENVTVGRIVKIGKTKKCKSCGYKW